MNKRKWCYAYNPKKFGIECDKCSSDNIEWSEFEHKIWCYDCKEDVDGTGGIFDGPIPVQTTQLMLNINFNRINLETNTLEIAVFGDGLEYISEEEYTKRILLNTLNGEKVEEI